MERTLLQTILVVRPESCKEKLREIPCRLGEVLNRVRSFSTGLRPVLLDDLGLHSALRSYVDEFTGRTQVRVDFKQEGLEGRRFANETESGAFRMVVQEALDNVARHAGVKRPTLQVRANDRGIELQIANHGRGFGSRGDAPTLGSGLAGLREHAALLGGQLTIDSAPGQGTVITASLSAHPVPQREARNMAH